MKTLKSKSGFTLVELMIVVVIMGILVAIAVPVYGAITRNSEKKTCSSNQEIIVKAVQQCTLTNMEAGAACIYKGTPERVEVKSQTDAEQYFTEAYLNCFDGGQFPLCPTAGNFYTIELDESGRTIIVVCASEGDTGHGSWK